MIDQTPHTADATNACLLFVPKTNESTGNLFDRPIFEVRFGRGNKNWLAPGLTPGEVGAEVPRGELPKAEWAHSLPGDPSLNVSAQLAVRVALDVQYRAPSAVHPPKHVFFTGQLVNDSLVEVGDVLVKGIFAAAIQFRQTDAATTPRDIVLISPSLPAMTADIGDYLDRWGKSVVRHHGQDWSVTIGATQDGRLRVTFSPPPGTSTRPIPLHVRYIAARNVEEVWNLIKAEGGVPVSLQPTPIPFPRHEMPNPENGRWLLGIALTAGLFSAALGLNWDHTAPTHPLDNTEASESLNPDPDPRAEPSADPPTPSIPTNPDKPAKSRRKQRMEPVESPQMPPAAIEPPPPPNPVFEIRCEDPGCVPAHRALANALTQEGYSGSASLKPGEIISRHCYYAPPGQERQPCTPDREHRLINLLQQRALNAW